jgi:hypothetical protein
VERAFSISVWRAICSAEGEPAGTLEPVPVAALDDSQPVNPTRRIEIPKLP